MEKQGIKHDTGKPRPSLLEWDFINKMVQVLEFGAEKYSADGWRNVPDAQKRYWDAAMRHLIAAQNEDTDTESGLPHLAHVAVNCMFLCFFINQENECTTTQCVEFTSCHPMTSDEVIRYVVDGKDREMKNILPLNNEQDPPEEDLSDWQSGDTKPEKDGFYLREFFDGIYISEYVQGSWRYDGFFDSDEQCTPWCGLKG